MLIQGNEMHGSIVARNSVGDASESTAALSMHSLVNMIPGQVTSVHQGLLNVGIRVRIGERTDLRVRWPLGSDLKPGLVGGPPVQVMIPAEAGHLESGYFRLGKRRWNRWIGRIVLIETVQDRRVVSVKLHGDRVTLKCCGSMTGLNWVPRVWDTLNIVVDPAQIRLDAGIRNHQPQTVDPGPAKFDHVRDARVWMRAQVTEVGEAPEGMFLSLLIGAACVSVFIGREDDNFNQWRSGVTLDIHVGRYDACLKPYGGDSAPILCRVLYLDSQSLVVTP